MGFRVGGLESGFFCGDLGLECSFASRSLV